MEKTRKKKTARSGKRPKALRGFASLAAVIEEAIQGLGLEEMVAKGAAMLLWPEVVGEGISRVTRPETLRGSTLVVTVADSAWLQQLRYMEEQILEELNAAIGGRAIEELYFKVGPLPRPSVEPKAPEETAVDIDPETATLLEEAVAGLQDPELRDTLRQLLAASLRKEGGQ